MNLYQEVLCNVLKDELIEIRLPNIPTMVNLVELKCYHTLEKIKAVLEDDDLSDVACFQKIEEIVTIFESIGSDGGNRHDFG